MARLTVVQNGTETAFEFCAPQKLSAILSANGVAFVEPCGGRGVCRNCAVEGAGALSEPDAGERESGKRLLCQTTALGDCRIILPDFGQMSVEAGELAVSKPQNSAIKLGAALDVGTTTLAMRVYDLQSGACVGQATRINPQTRVAADVIGRIGAALDGQEQVLRTMIQDAVRDMLREASGNLPVYRMAVAGNTVMLYLMNGFDTRELSKAPFIASHLFGTHCTADGMDIFYAPCFHAFAGADLACAVLASGMCEHGGISLLCDVGTNGEIALYKDGVLYTASTAAGPALEGAGISCGVPSVPGAIDRVWREGKEVRCHTVGEQPSIGVCGSGLIDLLAALLDGGEIDETGRMEQPFALCGVVLQPADVRAVQLAKAAICAGICTLLKKTGTRADEVERFYIAGGFGSRIDPSSAARIGLFPEALAGRSVAIGNAALAGAGAALLENAAEEKLLKIRSSDTYVSLSGDPDFSEFYYESMLF